MREFKVGDIVRHRLDGETIRIKRMCETVATCEEINKGKIEINIKGIKVYPVRISSTDNLIKNDPQADLTVSNAGTVTTKI